MSKRLTHDELIEDGIRQIIRAFGKGEDLRGAMWYIVTGSAQWGADIEAENIKKKAKATKKANKPKAEPKPRRNTKSFERVASDLRKSADTSMRKDLSHWDGRDTDDADMRKMFRKDHKNALKIANLIEKGNIKKAMESISDLDTGARDEVGAAIYKKSRGFYNEYMIPEGWCF